MYEESGRDQDEWGFEITELMMDPKAFAKVGSDIKTRMSISICEAQKILDEWTMTLTNEKKMKLQSKC